MVSPVSLTCVVLALLITVAAGDTIRCYDCNSGGVGWDNPNCPANGDLVPKYVTTVDCEEQCFTRTDKWNPGTIYRGCSKPYWLDHEALPTGCKEDYLGNYWCFCDTDDCNTVSMADRR